MYSLHTLLPAVSGIGPQLAQKLELYDLRTVLDFLLWLPLRYEDRSQMVEIKDLQVGELVTLQATVLNARNYYKGRRSIQSATVFDHTGRLKLMWFNNKFIIDKLKPQETYLISGKLNDRGVMVQPTVENVSADTIHTARLIPVYSKLSSIKQGTLRRILKHILDNLESPHDSLVEMVNQIEPTKPNTSFSALSVSLQEIFKVLHFPEDQDRVVLARERLALEELLSLIQHSQEIKAKWEQERNTFPITIHATAAEPIIPASIPFALTASQQQAVGEVLEDLQAPHPMNRLLLGDVGAGKTVVAGIAIHHVLKNGHAAALIAPTQILAEQHFETLQKLFPDLPIELMTAKTSLRQGKKGKRGEEGPSQTASSKLDQQPKLYHPKLYVGTQSVINRLELIRPALIIYDEQHRFGVSQRSFAPPDQLQPNILTMSATPIPRSLMLTLFAHLSVSHLTELPPGRLPVKSWVVPHSKKHASWDWLAEQIANTGMQVFIVCPFIDTSDAAEFEHVAAATQVFEEVSGYLAQSAPHLKLELLHGKMSTTAKTQITKRLYAKDVDVLVTTPVIEVGLDVPNAGAIVIESSERFGLASLHQLRGRVGRAGQQAYCLLFTSKPTKNERLEQFAAETNGLKLAELDLQRRGAGDLFGTQQSGFDSLRFANWTNLDLITQARQLFELLQKNNPDWKPVVTIKDAQTSPVAAN